MAPHKKFPVSPHAILDPAIRWFPAGEALRETGMDQLTPPDKMPKSALRRLACRD